MFKISIFDTIEYAVVLTLILGLEKQEDIFFTGKLLLEMSDSGVVQYLLSWSTLCSRGLAELNELYEAVVETIWGVLVFSVIGTPIIYCSSFLLYVHID